MLRLSRAFLWLAKWCVDIDEFLDGGRSWKEIRARRKQSDDDDPYPEGRAEFKTPEVRRRPF